MLNKITDKKIFENIGKGIKSILLIVQQYHNSNAIVLELFSGLIPN